MKKRSLFLSATLTTFILSAIAGIIRARANDGQEVIQSTVPPVVQVAQATDTQPPTDVPPPTVAPYISYQEAVAIAVARLGSSDLYSVETTTLGSMDVYKVTFSSGNAVYVSPVGHILVVTSPVVVVQSSNSSGGSYSAPQSAPKSAPTGSEGSDDSGGDH